MPVACTAANQSESTRAHPLAVLHDVLCLSVSVCMYVRVNTSQSNLAKAYRTFSPLVLVGSGPHLIQDALGCQEYPF